ncbi:acyltransferase domain-containing protein [Streptomyces chryseus]
MLLDASYPAADQNSGHLWLGSFATSVVAARQLEAAGVPQDVVVGHSGGEVTALVVAGCLSIEDGARVLCERAKAVEGSGLPPGGMVVLRTSVRRTARLCRAIDSGHLSVAVDNGPRQVVVSGELPAIEMLEQVAEVLQIETSRLGIPDSYHNPRLAGAARRMMDELADIRLRPPLARIYSPQLGRYIANSTDAQDLLEGMLMLPVGFRQALTHLYDEGVETFIECGAKQILSNAVTNCLPTVARAVPLLASRTQAASFSDLASDMAGRTVSVLPSPTAAAVKPLVPPKPAEPSGPPPQAHSSGRLPAEPELRDEIRRIYAEALQYPVDVVEDDVELEAELGVSSLKQTQVFVRLLDRYGLATPSSSVKIASYRTVAEVASLLRQLADSRFEGITSHG